MSGPAQTRKAPAVVAGPNRAGGGMVFGRPVEKARDFWGTSRRLAGYLRPHHGRMTTVFVFSVLSTVFMIVGPKILGKATTKLFEGLMAKYAAFMLHQPMPSIDFVYIGRIMAWLLFFYLLSALFTYVQQYLMAGVAQTVVFDLRAEVERKLSKLPLRYYDSHSHGDILSRVTNDVDTISTTLQQSLTQLITSACSILGVVVMMLTISPLLTLIAMVTLPLSFAVTAGIAKYSQTMFASQQRELGELNGHVEEMYAGHRIVKAFGREAASVERFQSINLRLYGAGWRAQFVSGIIFPMMNFISNLGYVAVCVVGGVMVTKRSIDLGDIQAFIQYMRSFTQPIVQTANIVNILQSTVASAERVFEVLDETEESPDAADAPAAGRPRGAVRFEHVRFGYTPERVLMRDLSLDVKPGQTIAIVGPTGAGKTTLVNLLLRFYDVDDGRITVDGTDIRRLRRGDLRTMFGMVLQDTWLFNGTIRENIAYCCPDAPLERVKEAARAAHADHFIRALPLGYDTPLGDEASDISQGERQLLTIARAILADPAILILDEATSSVDTRTEVFIQKAMRRLMHGRTSFVIAHRLSTIRDAELILVMRDGSIIETGSHKQLLAQKGFYADLYNSQFTGAYEEEPAA